MNRDERKRKFNEAIVNMLYPSPPHPEPSPPTQDLEPLEALIQVSSSDHISDGLDEYEIASSSDDDDDEHESGTEKLTRAQRKKIRKKKLKEEAIGRGKLIGPLLPPTYEASVYPPAVRSNAASEESSGADYEPGDKLGRDASKKTKNRRVAKRLAKEKRITSTSEDSNDYQASISASSSIDPKEAPM